VTCGRGVEGMAQISILFLMHHNIMVKYNPNRRLLSSILFHIVALWQGQTRHMRTQSRHLSGPPPALIHRHRDLSFPPPHFTLLPPPLGGPPRDLAAFLPALAACHRDFTGAASCLAAFHRDLSCFHPPIALFHRHLWPKTGPQPSDRRDFRQAQDIAQQYLGLVVTLTPPGPVLLSPPPCVSLLSGKV
jgi:hypothetical protein